MKKYSAKILVVLSAVFAVSFALSASVYAASGFKIAIDSIADLGHEFAGGAALADDASANYYNAAGIVRMKRPELVGGVAYVSSDTTFKGSVAAPGLSSYTASGKARTDSSGFIPNLHFVMPLPHKFSLGISLTAPYGLGSDYPEDSILRYSVIQAKANVFNIGPGLAYAFNDKLSIGAGPDFQYFKFKTETAVRTQPFSSQDSTVENNASGWGYGWHAGVMYQFTPKTRVGISYRSRIVQNLNGDSTFKFPGGIAPASKTKNNNFKTRLVLPPIAMFSIYHAFNEHWAVMGTADYTQWSVLKNIVSKNAAGPGGISQNVTTPENFHSTWHFALGADYKYSDRWLFRAGVGRDQTPTNNRDRDMIIPNADNYAATLGVHFQATKDLGFDAAYSHAFIDTARIRHTSAATGASENGKSNTTGDVIGLQLSYQFGKSV